MITRKLATVFLFCLAASLGASCGKKAPPPTDSQPTVGSSRPRLAVAPGETAVDLGNSTISMKVVKNQDFKSPVHATFGLRDGAIALAAGTARLSIDLETFDSGLPLRNERVRTMFFETAAAGWETAELTIAKIPGDALVALRNGKPAKNVSLEAELKLHGTTIKLALVVDATFKAGGALLVKNPEPVRLKISELAMTDNLRRLNTLCQHASVEDVVAIDVALEFLPR